MPYFPVPDTCQLEMVYQSNEPTNLVENVYHFHRVGGFTPAQMTDLITYMQNWETTYAKAQRGTSTALLKIRVRDLSVANGAIVGADMFVAGTHTGSHYPSHVTWAIKWTTGLSGRSNRGRTYWIGLTESMSSAVDDNQIDPTVAGAIVSAASNIITGTIPDTAQLVVVSRRLNNAWRSPPVTIPITAVGYADQIFDSQRRRLPGHNRRR